MKGALPPLFFPGHVSATYITPAREPMKTQMTILALLVIAFGAALFIFGEYDDSPGGQLIGLIVALYGVYALWRALRS